MREEPGSETLLEAVNEQIHRLKAGGRYGQIVERWQGRVYDWGKTAADFLD